MLIGLLIYRLINQPANNQHINGYSNRQGRYGCLNVGLSLWYLYHSNMVVFLKKGYPKIMQYQSFAVKNYSHLSRNTQYVYSSWLLPMVVSGYSWCHFDIIMGLSLWSIMELPFDEPFVMVMHSIFWQDHSAQAEECLILGRAVQKKHILYESFC